MVARARSAQTPLGVAFARLGIAGELRSRHSTREPDVPRLAAVAGWHGTQTTPAAFCRGALSQSTEVSMIPSFWLLPAQVS